MMKVIVLFCAIHVVLCACPNGCTGNGRCNQYNVCHCTGLWTGHDCSQRLCPKGKAWGIVTGVDKAHETAECSGRGICDRSTGACLCQAGFDGHACQKLACSDNCNLKGTCASMKQLAAHEVLALEHHNGAPYSYTEVWDATSVHGCICDKSFTGSDCRVRTCPTGDDPLTTGQTDEIQLITCLTEYLEQDLVLNFDTAPTSGSFILAFGSEYTRPIVHDATDTGVGGVSVEEKLKALNGITDVTVAKVTTAVSRTWKLTFPTGNAQHNYIIPKWRMLEVQSFFCAADGGTFSIQYSTEAALTGLPFSADTATIKSGLESYSSIETVDVSFSDGAAACATGGNTVTITFTAMRDRVNVGNLPQLILDSSSLTLGIGAAVLDPVAKELVRGIDTCRAEEVQSVVCTATSGRFSLTFDGTTVSDISYSATTSDIKARLESISSVLVVDVAYSSGTAACSEAGNTITVTFGTVTTLGPNSDGDLPEITADITNGAVSPLQHSTTENLALAAVFTEVTKGVVCQALDQPFTTNPPLQMTCDIIEGGGSFQVSFRGKTTENIPTSASAAQVEQYLTSLDTISGISVSFTGTEACTKPENVMRVVFTQEFGDVPSMSVDGTLLSTGSSIAVKTAGQTVQSVVSYEGTKENAECSGRGTCDSLQGFGCSCYLGYTSSDGRGNAGNAEISRGDCGATLGVVSACPGEIPCSGHGACSGSSTYKCDCEDGWTNGECSERTCPKGTSWFSYPSADNVAHRDLVECSAGGICDRTTGVCSCQRPFTGAACEHMSCGGAGSVECSGHGQCMELRQLATETKVNGVVAGYTYGTDPNNAQTWDAIKIKSCVCDNGYTGYDCSLRECPRGDDPSTFNSVAEMQVLKCTATGGTFTLTFREETSVDIPYNSDQTSLQSALEALDEIGTVSIIYDTGAVACSATGVTISITFETELGELPALTLNTDKLQDNVGGSGADGTGSIEIAIHGEVLGAVTSVTGTRENAECSNHGLCDYTIGVCKCDSQYTSSNGFGALGQRRDCGVQVTEGYEA